MQCWCVSIAHSWCALDTKKLLLQQNKGCSAQICWLGFKSCSEGNSDWWQKCLLTPQAYASIKELWLGSEGEGCSVLWAAMWMTKWKKVVGEKEECSLPVYGKILPKFRWDRVTASWERGRSTSTPKCQRWQKETFLRDPEGTRQWTLLQPRRPLQAAGVGARLDERISSVRTQ